MWTYNYTNPNELYHTGRKGMKWYQHIYTTADKLSTPSIKAGKDKSPISPGEKLGRETSTILSDTSSVVDSVGRIRRKNNYDKHISKMSNEELQDKINRMALENRYSDLKSSRVSNGYAYTKEILSIAGSVAGIATAGFGIAATIKNLKE